MTQLRINIIVAKYDVIFVNLILLFFPDLLRLHNNTHYVKYLVFLILLL